MTNEKYNEFIVSIKDIIEIQNKQRDTLKKLVLTVLNKHKGPMTIHEWEKESSEALYHAGLGSEPLHLRWKRLH